MPAVETIVDVSDKQHRKDSLASNRCIVYLFSEGYRNAIGLFAESS
jgi:hypothetical protein